MGLSGRYKVQVSPLDEDEAQIELDVKNYPPQDYARTLAERKAQALAVSMPHIGEVTLIIGSDTIVDLDGSISELIFSTELISTQKGTCTSEAVRYCPCLSHPRPASPDTAK